MNRRRFLKLLGLAPVAPTVFSFGTGVWTPAPVVPWLPMTGSVGLIATAISVREGENLLWTRIGPDADCHYRTIADWEQATQGDLTRPSGPMAVSSQAVSRLLLPGLPGLP